MNNDFSFHEFSTMFPVMEGAEFDGLVADIKANGQHEPIVVLDEQILDGRNRYLACRKLKITPRARDFNCTDGDPLAFVWSANVARRHLSQGQLGLAMAKRVEFLAIGNVKAQKALVSKEKILVGHGGLPKPISNNAAAKMAKVSPKTIQRAKVVLKNASPKEIVDIERGSVPLHAVAEKYEPIKQSTKKLTTSEFDIVGGGRIGIPNGYTVEEYTREGLKIEDETGLEPYKVSKKLKVADDSYRKMREIVLINDIADLPPQDRVAATTALKLLNTHKQVNCYSLVEDISKRIWGEKRKTKENAIARAEEFESKIDIITHICTTDIEIPQLNTETVGFAIKGLEESIKGLNKLINNIKEIYKWQKQQ